MFGVTGSGHTQEAVMVMVPVGFWSTPESVIPAPAAKFNVVSVVPIVVVEFSKTDSPDQSGDMIMVPGPASAALLLHVMRLPSMASMVPALLLAPKL